MSKLSIFEPDSTNAETLAVLSSHTFKNAYSSNLPNDELDNYVTEHFSLHRVQSDLNNPDCKFLLAFEDSYAVGYAMLKKSTPPAAITGSNPVELVRIYLIEDVIGKGYGSLLMEACLETARREGYKNIWLGVWEKNERAIRFYEKWGFTKVGSTSFRFGSEIQTDLLMMRLITDTERKN